MYRDADKDKDLPYSIIYDFVSQFKIIIILGFSVIINE